MPLNFLYLKIGLYTSITVLSKDLEARVSWYCWRRDDISWLLVISQIKSGWSRKGGVIISIWTLFSIWTKLSFFFFVRLNSTLAWPNGHDENTWSHQNVTPRPKSHFTRPNGGVPPRHSTCISQQDSILNV